jgi:MFS family permease
MHRNFRRLYADIFWYGILAGSALAFLSIYAARLGASAFQIGLLTAGPALVNLFVSLPAGRWMEERPLIGVSFWSAVFQRFGYLLLILLPIFFDAQEQIVAIIVIILGMSFPGTLMAIGFNAMFAEIVPGEMRSEVVGRRNALLALSMTVSTLLSGFLLDQIAFPLNYQVVFGLGVLGGVMSTYYLARLHRVPTGEADSMPGGRTNGLSLTATDSLSLSALIQSRNALQKLDRLHLGGGAALRSLARFDLLRGRFGLFMTAYLLFYTFQYLCIPLFPLAYVDSLKLSDGMISMGTGLFYVTMFLISIRLKSLAVRYGHRRLLAASAIALSSYPLLMGLAKGPVLYLAASLAGGLVYGLVSASLVNRLMEVVPEKERAAGMAFHNLALNLGILVGSLAAPILADVVGIQEGLLLGAGLRLLAGLLMVLWG